MNYFRRSFAKPSQTTRCALQWGRHCYLFLVVVGEVSSVGGPLTDLCRTTSQSCWSEGHSHNAPARLEKSRYYLSIYQVMSIKPQWDIMETQSPYLSLHKHLHPVVWPKWHQSAVTSAARPMSSSPHAALNLWGDCWGSVFWPLTTCCQCCIAWSSVSTKWLDWLVSPSSCPPVWNSLHLPSA